MNIVAYRLIPDQGSAGYKLYQEELKAAAAAKVAQTEKAAAPKPATPKVTSAKPAEPEKTAAEATTSPKDGAAMDFFLNTAKVKYKAAGDRTKVEGSVTLGGKVTTAEQKRQMVGNPFVTTAKNDFMSILSSLDGYGRSLAGVEKYQAKIAEGDMSYLNDLTMSQSVADDGKYGLVKVLGRLKQWAEENNTLPETQEFFGEYTEFTRGEKLDLLKLFDTFDVA